MFAYVAGNPIRFADPDGFAGVDKTEPEPPTEPGNFFSTIWRGLRGWLSKSFGAKAPPGGNEVLQGLPQLGRGTVEAEAKRLQLELGLMCSDGGGAACKLLVDLNMEMQSIDSDAGKGRVWKWINDHWREIWALKEKPPTPGPKTPKPGEGPIDKPSLPGATLY